MWPRLFSRYSIADFTTFRPQRPLPVHQADHRAVLPEIAHRQLVEQLAEQSVLGRHRRLALDLSDHLRPDVLVLRLGTVLGPLVPQHLIEDVVGGAHERLDAVDRTDAGYPLLVRLLALGPAMVRLRSFRLRLPHRDP